MKPRQKLLSPTISETTKVHLELIFRSFIFTKKPQTKAKPKNKTTLLTKLCSNTLIYYFHCNSSLSLLRTQSSRNPLFSKHNFNISYQCVAPRCKKLAFYSKKNHSLKCINNLSRDMAESTLLEVFKMQVDRVLGNLTFLSQERNNNYS